MTYAELRRNPAADAFWAGLAARDHCLQIYDSDRLFLNALEGFVAGGIRQGDSIVLIATPAHLSALAARLSRNGFDVDAAVERGQYIALDAAQTLARFMVDGWPDEAMFNAVVDELLGRARRHHHKVRAFGEMVALMWADGLCDAAVQLEHFWTRLCVQEEFSLFCAYPKAAFGDAADAGIHQVCAAHSKLYTM
ncbi:hypothetical protein HHL21_17705 [Massilia sp. RP-1-19]|uniref:MEDS domain-containing protein n=1 Tax=Massilia polaris TaxID=2728846 RepID=A0A848HS07_9BURK|nr:MEDS domain-containing protein [Massilia polaris]NML62879.1 hypothetical protein [Massilia polaris]